jgi:hypothetical protein
MKLRQLHSDLGEARKSILRQRHARQFALEALSVFLPILR